MGVSAEAGGLPLLWVGGGGEWREGERRERQRWIDFFFSTRSVFRNQT